MGAFNAACVIAACLCFSTSELLISFAIVKSRLCARFAFVALLKDLRRGLSPQPIRFWCDRIFRRWGRRSVLLLYPLPLLRPRLRRRGAFRLVDQSASETLLSPRSLILPDNYEVGELN